MANELRFLDGDLLFVGGKLAMHADCCCDEEEEEFNPCDGIGDYSDCDLEVELSGGTYGTECVAYDCVTALEGATFLLPWDAGFSKWLYSGNITASCGSVAASELEIGFGPFCSGTSLVLQATAITTSGFFLLGNTDPGTDNSCIILEADNYSFGGNPIIGTWYTLVNVSAGSEHSDVICQCTCTNEPTVRFRFVPA